MCLNVGKIQLDILNIFLDKPTACFTRKENIKGYCFIKLKGELHISKLEIILYGSAYTKVPQGKGSIRDSHVYLNISYLPLKDKTNPRILKFGEHRIPFNFLLPTGGIANSFEGKYGDIRYYIKAIIHKPGLMPKHEVKSMIRICYPVDIPLDILRVPRANSIEQEICCCSRGFVELEAHIVHTGQKTGKSTSVNCTVNNKSKITMQLSAALKMIIIYKAQGISITDKTIVARSMSSSIGSRISRNLSLTLPIPKDLPLSNVNCPIIEIRYKIVVTLNIPFNFNLFLKLPVIIVQKELNFHPNS